MAALALFSWLLWTYLRPPTVRIPQSPATPAQEGELDRLVKQLGDDNPIIREDAVKKLVAGGDGARAALRKALGSPDSEVRARAQDVLDRLPLEFELLQKLPSIGGVSLSPDGSLLALYPAKERFEVRSTKTWKTAWSTPVQIDTDKFGLFIPAFTADSSRVYAVLAHGELTLLRASEGTAERRIPLTASGRAFWGPRISVVPFSDGNLLINTGGPSSHLYLQSKDSMYNLVGNTVVADPEGARIVALRDDTSLSKGSLLQYDPKTWRVIASGELGGPLHRWVAWPQDLSRLYLAPKRGIHVTVCDPSSLRSLGEYPLLEASTMSQSWISCLGASPEGRWLAVGTSDGLVKIYRTRDMELERTLKITEEVKHVEFAAGASLFVVQGVRELHIYRRRE